MADARRPPAPIDRPTRDGAREAPFERRARQTRPAATCRPSARCCEMSAVAPDRPAIAVEAFPPAPPRLRRVDITFRALDLLLAGTALLVLSPLIALIAVAI